MSSIHFVQTKRISFIARENLRRERKGMKKRERERERKIEREFVKGWKCSKRERED